MKLINENDQERNKNDKDLDLEIKEIYQTFYPCLIYEAGLISF